MSGAVAVSTVRVSVTAGPPSLETESARVVVTLLPGATWKAVGVKVAARSSAVTAAGVPATR